MVLNLTRLSSLALIFEKALSLGISMLVFIAIANYLSVSDFGEYAYYLAFVGLLVPFFSLGLNSLVTKEVLSVQPNVSVVANTAILRLAFGLIIVLSIIFFDIFFTELKYEAEFHLLLLCIVLTGCQVCDFGFQAFEQHKYVIFTRLFVLILGGLVKLIGVYWGFRLTDFLLVVAAEYVVSNIMLWLLFRQYRPEYALIRFDVGYCVDLLKRSVWLYLSAICAVLYLKLDQVMLRQLVNPTEVAHYAVAAKFTELFYFIPIALMTAYFPKLINASASQYQLYCHRLSVFLLWGSIALIICVLLSSELLVGSFFSDQYLVSVSIISIHVWSLIFVFQRALLSKWLLVEKLYKFSLISQGSGAILNITLNLWLIPLYGAIGAAWATVVSHIMSSTVILLISSRTRPMFVLQCKALMWPLNILASSFSSKNI